jgi:hypothetical protein
VVAVVAIVRVEVTAAALVIVAEAGLRLQVAGLVAPDGPVTAHVNATVPVKPPDGVAVIVEVFPVVAPVLNVSVAGLLLRAKPAVGPVLPVTNAVIASVWTNFPVESVTVTNTLYGWLAAEDPALMVRVSGVVAPLVRVAEEVTEQVTVWPAQVKVTAPLNPLTEVRLIVSVPGLLLVTGTRVVSGTIEKSESGLEMALPLFSVNDEVANGLLSAGEYCRVTKFAPWNNVWLFSVALKVEAVPEVGVLRGIPLLMRYPDE